MMVLIYVQCMGSRLYTKYILVDLSNYLHRFFLLPITYTVISALQAATLFEADFEYRPQIGRLDINTGHI